MNTDVRHRDIYICVVCKCSIMILRCTDMMLKLDYHALDELEKTSRLKKYYVIKKIIVLYNIAKTKKILFYYEIPAV